MKVALYSGFFPSAFGGARRAQVLAEFLIREGHDVTVVTGSALGPHKELPYPVIRRPSFFRMVEAARKAEVVHTTLATREISAVVAGGRRPIVTHDLHTAICPTGSALSEEGCTASAGCPGPCSSCPRRREARARFDMALWRTGIKLAKANVCVSRYAAERLGPPRCTMIYNPVDPSVYLARDLGPGEDGLVVFVGRYDPFKGLGLLIQALSLVPGTRLEVVGGGPPSLRERWEEEARRCGVANRVQFLGPKGLAQILDLYARAAVVCVPSIYEETFGYVAAEAMAAGRAVVATPKGALPELLDEGRGFVSKSLDPIDLATALRSAMENPTIKKEAEQRSRCFAESQFSVATVGQRYLDLYQQTGVNPSDLAL
jgi:glycosyltransferase involved in cell wall biosynthesis